MKFLFVLILFPIFNSCKTNETFFGKWKVISASILITSDLEDKIQLMNSCQNQSVYIFPPETKIDIECIFNKKIKETYIDKEVSYSILKLTDEYGSKFNSQLNLNDNSTQLFKILKLKISYLDNTKDSCDFIIIDEKKAALFFNPYLLILKK